MADFERYKKLVLAFSGYNRGWSEAHFITGNTLLASLQAAKHICYWRAAILARGFEMRYANIAMVGPKKEAYAVVSKPLQGGIGVNAGTTNWPTEDSLFTNAPDTSLRYRFETETGHSAVRQIRGLPDGIVKKFKYQFADSIPDDAPDGAETTVDAATLDLPPDVLWDYATPPTSSSTPAAGDYYSYQTCLRNYLAFIRTYTYWSKFTADDTVSTSTVTAATAANYVSDPPVIPADGEIRIADYGIAKWNSWVKVFYRGVSGLRTGRPSLL
jgi:hypothetical protein